MRKSLSLHNRVTVEGHIASVQYLSLRYFCNTCKVILDDHYHSHCKLPNIVFEASLRLLLEDGSGEAHLYIDNELVPEVLLISTDDWRRLVQSVQTKGSLVYIKQKHNFPGDPTNSLELKNLINRREVYRYIKANVKPFVSKDNELNEGVDYSQWSFRVGAQEYSTTSYNKLQLKLISLVHADIVRVCNTLFQKVLS
ncbi:PREDICTED: uncharacterized protein LOC109586036 [Amphimedon queenslandica]|uniref:CST complex subunit CTC1 n=1 Tax=Amphimedon queenslandica TaxID=400682 RepID=A0AAN0JL70_AMPQE|nr:PREDICTED: uncharacterized protein LOC109586036 [Amphimedon queenslandica]|eukprot:XP_019857762.1 PREDICTED: uncharacterized protein LOC109586036 [Amphimedon queenslandica]